LLSYIFRAITVRSIGAIICSFILTLFLVPVIIKRMKKKEFGQAIREDGPKSHLEKTGIPTMGGIAILIAIIVTSVFWAGLNKVVLIALSAFLMLGILGIIDDILKIAKSNSKGVSGKIKILVQVLVAIFMVIALYNISWLKDSKDISAINLPILKKINLGFFYVPFIVLVIVGSSNAVNLTDGLDGLAAGILMVVFMAYAAVCYVAGNYIFSEHLNIIFIPYAGELTVLACSVIGALLGFLWYNSHPASIFMGDTGSLALGGLLSILAVLTKTELMLLIIGGIFVIEALSVIIQVISFKLRGKRVFKMAPLHHHFELKGYKETKIVIRFWILTFILTLVGLTIFGFNIVVR